MKQKSAAAAGLLAAALFGGPALRAESVATVVEYFAVDSSALPGLLLEDDAEDGLRARVMELVGAGEARIVGNAYLLGRGDSKERGRIESIREWVYGTEFDPAETVARLKGPVAPDAVVVRPPVPTAFEMRPTGLRIDALPTVRRGGRTVDLVMAAERTEYLGVAEWGHDFLAIPQPLFHSNRAGANATIPAGRPVLFGVFNPAAKAGAKEPGERLLGFVTLSVLPQMPAREAPDPFAGDADLSDARVEVTVEYIEVAATRASAIIAEGIRGGDAGAARRDLDPLPGEGGAALLETVAVSARLGVLQKGGATVEYPYPGEHDPDRPPSFDAPDPNPPQIFETRELGTILGVTARAGGEHGTIALELACSRVTLARVVTIGRDPGAVEQPIFETLSCATSLTVTTGATQLVAMHDLEGARAGEAALPGEQAAVRDRRTLVFVTARFRAPQPNPKESP